MKKLLLFYLLFPIVLSNAQNSPKIHSHNDYKQETPFWDAFAVGANSIEVDVICKNGQLFVAHEELTIKANYTFEALYLEPLKHVSKLFEGKRLDFQLLVDIKTDAQITLNEVIKTIEPYKQLLRPYKRDGVLITISGNRPKPDQYVNYPDHIYFDCQEILATKGAAWEKVSMISTSFKNVSRWNGLGRMIAKEQNLVADFIKKAKTYNKPVRFWASPDTKTAWKDLSELGVEYINTDTPKAVATYFESLKKRTYEGISLNRNIYQPNFQHDEMAGSVKNVILLIGDGMGLAQISSGDLLSNSGLNITRLKSIGLIRTQAADNFGTDSAAGATAYATGKQTNNRAIGTDTQGKPLTNITELLSAQGYSTAVITTDNITGATPAAFYAHVIDRDEETTIWEHLISSNLDFFASVVQKGFNNQQEELERQFRVLYSSAIFDFPEDERIALFLSKGDLLPEKSGRYNIMPKLIEQVLPYLRKKEKPFFIMIEGAKIDSYGHANDMQGIVKEVLNFDTMVAEALKFADKDGETLVLITADHETGGLSLSDGDLGNKTIEGDFTTNDHTGTFIPIFAYGPGASMFSGVYANFELYNKIISLLPSTD